jgi:hypothetical protein
VTAEGGLLRHAQTWVFDLVKRAIRLNKTRQERSIGNGALALQDGTGDLKIRSKPSQSCDCVNEGARGGPRLCAIALSITLMTTPAGARAEEQAPCSGRPTLTGRIAGIDLGAGSAGPVLRLAPTTGPLPTGIRLTGVVLPAAAGQTGRDLMTNHLGEVVGADVTVETTAVNRLDRYGRMTGLVRLKTGETLQEHLLGAGLVIADGQDAACWNDFVGRETQARHERHGIWNHSALITAVRDAASLALPDLVILRGRVASVATAGRSAYLNFGANRYTGPTIRLTATAIEALAKRGLAAEDLAGRIVEARGWAEARNGLLLTLSDGALMVVGEDRD